MSAKLSATTPKRRNVRFHATAAAAQGSGFRACRRCRPDAVPGSADWNVRADVVGRAMRLIADGVVDREGVAGSRNCPGGPDIALGDTGAWRPWRSYAIHHLVATRPAVVLVESR